MKVKSSNYHTSTTTAAEARTGTGSTKQSIHQPVLSSNTNHLTSSGFKGDKSGNKGGGP